jgi:hypothetical protein
MPIYGRDSIHAMHGRDTHTANTAHQYGQGANLATAISATSDDDHDEIQVHKSSGTSDFQLLPDS